MKVFIIFCLTCSVAYADPLPNYNLTPGVARTDLNQQQICTIKWGKDHRAVTEGMKLKVFQSYGFINGDKDPRCPCEIDHLISRELSGADDIKNLWPQSYSGDWNAHMKDKLENKLHVEMCAGKLTLEQAQQMIRDDWTKSYIQYFGVPK